MIIATSPALKRQAHLETKWATGNISTEEKLELENFTKEAPVNSFIDRMFISVIRKSKKVLN